MSKMFLPLLEEGFLEEIKQLSSDGNTLLESICKPVVCHIAGDEINLSLIKKCKKKKKKALIKV